jgi:steroid delta-isomerase-like uncharacterized protein
VRYAHYVTSDPVDLMRDTFDLLNARDIDGCLARMADDFQMFLAGAPEPLVGKDVWRGNLDYLISAFPDFRVRVDDVFGAGDRVTCLMTLSGTHRGEFLGVAPTGREVSFASYEVYRVVDGTITAEWILTDLHSLLAQLS